MGAPLWGKALEGDCEMPILRLEMLEGRSLDQKRAFVEAATRAAVETLACPPESLDVIITEMPRSHWAKGGKLMSEK